MNGQLLTPDDLAERWSVPKSQVYRLTREGKLKPVCLGRYYRYRLGAVEDFEEHGGTAPTGGSFGSQKHTNGGNG